MREFILQPAQLLLLSSFLLVAIAPAVHPQTPATSPDPDAVRKAAAEADLKEHEAVLKATEVDAKRFDLLKSQLSELRTNPTVTTPVIENEISAALSLRCLTTKVWTNLGRKGISDIVIYDPQLARVLMEYPMTVERVDSLTARYDFLFSQLMNLDSGNGQAYQLRGPGMAASVGVTLLSLFKQDVNLTGSKVELDKGAFAASLVSTNPGGIRIWDPAKISSFSINTSKLSKTLEALHERVQKSRNMESLNRLHRNYQLRNEMRAKLIISSDANERTKLENQITSVDQEIKRLKAFYRITADDDVLELIANELKSLNATTDVLLRSLGLASSGTTDASGAATLIQLLKAEWLGTIFERQSAYWMDVTLVRGGGTAKIRKGILLGIFTPSKQISFSGGTVVSYTLFNNSGELKFSGVQADYQPFTKDVGRDTTCN